jgi:hypothetical protein
MKDAANSPKIYFFPDTVLYSEVAAMKTHHVNIVAHTNIAHNVSLLGERLVSRGVVQG